MKVLKNNYNKEETYTREDIIEYPRMLTCDTCSSELEYEENDIIIGSLGCGYVHCPCCGRNNLIDDYEGIVLTKDNVEFPTHFFHTSKETGAVDCCNNEEVKKYIHEAIEYFRKNKNKYNWYCCTGNLFVAVWRYDGDESYWVAVTNNYYETYIEFEEEDY